MVVTELNGNPTENETPKASLVLAETHAVAEEVVGGSPEAAKPEVDPHQTGLGAGCIVNVVIDPGDVVMDPSLGHMEAVEGLAMPEVLQQSQMVTEAFESSMEMAGMVESISETKS